MSDADAERALRAYRALVRIARHPEREPAWPAIVADLADAEAYYRTMPRGTRTAAQDRTWDEILRILYG
ncbi:MAG: hypothetical protein ACLQIB_39360 [Isosphaeraceae bacterium]